MPKKPITSFSNPTDKEKGKRFTQNKGRLRMLRYFDIKVMCLVHDLSIEEIEVLIDAIDKAWDSDILPMINTKIKAISSKLDIDRAAPPDPRR